MNKPTLTELGILYGTDKATYHNFTDFYESELKNDKVRMMLEIGILSGNSLRMWKDFYPDAMVIGIDVQEPLDIPNVICLNCDATDILRLKELFEGIEFDLIVDDGSHKTDDQIKTFNHLFYNNLRSGGVYICEDIHTSNRPEYINSDQTMIEYMSAKSFEEVTDSMKQYWRMPGDKTDSGTCLIRKR